MSLPHAWLLTVALLQQPDAPRPEILDGVAMQAGESLITLSELQRAKDRVMARANVKREEEAQLTRRLLRQLWDIRLEEQMGQELGLDPEAVERQTRAFLARERHDKGLDLFLEEVAQGGQDALEAEGDAARDMYRRLWEYSKTGTAAAGRRATVDRFLRPGELRFLYTDKLDELAPTLVQLQILVVSTRAAGNAEQARQTCEDARERVLEGEDMAALVDEFGASLRDTHGLLQYAPAAMIPDPGLRAFAQRAEIGELSVVEPLVDPRTGQRDPELGFQLVRLADRRESPQLLFDDQRVQHTLRQVSNDSQRERILERERARLRRESYSWVNPIFAPPPTPPVTGAGATGAGPGS